MTSQLKTIPTYKTAKTSMQKRVGQWHSSKAGLSGRIRSPEFPFDLKDFNAFLGGLRQVYWRCREGNSEI